MEYKLLTIVWYNILQVVSILHIEYCVLCIVYMYNMCMYRYRHRHRCRRRRRDLSPQKLKGNGHVLTELLKFQFFMQNTGILHYIHYTAINNRPVSIS